jgi:Tfp pilus assembly protein PilW
MYKILKISPWKKPDQRRSRQREQGFSLLELLISTSITVGIIGMSLQLLNQSQKLFQKQSGRISAQSRARKAINLITSDVRATGLTPISVTAGVIPGLAEAYSNRIRMYGDRQGDGTFESGNATNGNDDISYYVTSRKLYRVAPNDTQFGTAVMADNISLLSFRYYDAAGNEFVPAAATSLTQSQRFQVARIDMIVTVDIIEGSTITGSVTLESPIALRPRIMDGY